MKVLNLNTWGIHGRNWAPDYDVRYNAIKRMIQRSDYDIILLQEVWFQEIHRRLQGTFPYWTSFDTFNPKCSNFFDLPKDCSGLMILSRYTLKNVEFEPFYVSFDMCNIVIFNHNFLIIFSCMAVDIRCLKMGNSLLTRV